MRKNWLLMALSAAFSLLLLSLVFAGGRGSADADEQEDASVYLPVVLWTHDFGLLNGSFEDDNWRDVDSTKQEPADWTLKTVKVGDPLFDSGDLASGTCECVHKWDWQLPEEEQPGGSDPLILDGRLTYKIFSASQSFGTELSQTITGLEPGLRLRLTVPVRAHLYNDTDPYGAESSVWVNGIGAWANAEDMGDRLWCKHEQAFEVPDDGTINVAIRFKSKYPLVKDFFIDDVRLQAADEPPVHSDMPLCLANPVLERYRPVTRTTR